jgi:DNA-binding GntR family transcriptional regulator
MTETSRAASQLGRMSTLTKAEAVYLEVRARILDGSLQPGSTINQERLAADLGLSITPLREALRRLEAEELVTLRAHKILSIAPLTRSELHELCLIRANLDPLAATLAAKEATDQEIGAISALASRPHPQDLRERLGAHRAFHRAIYQASHNKVLAGILDQLWDRTDRYRLIVLRDHAFNRSTHTEHIKIAKAVHARDGDTAAELMQHHVQAALRTVEHMASHDLAADGQDEMLDETAEA